MSSLPCTLVSDPTPFPFSVLNRPFLPNRCRILVRVEHPDTVAERGRGVGFRQPQTRNLARFYEDRGGVVVVVGVRLGRVDSGGHTEWDYLNF